MNFLVLLILSSFSFDASANSCAEMESHGRLAVEKMEYVINLAQYSKKFDGDRLCKEVEGLQQEVGLSVEAGLKCYENSKKNLARVLEFKEIYLDGELIKALCVEKPDRYNTAKQLHFIKTDFEILF